MKRIIAGIEFESVRLHLPRPHWRAKCVRSGYVFEHGVFPCSTEEGLFDTIERTSKACGPRFATDTLNAGAEVLA